MKVSDYYNCWWATSSTSTGTRWTPYTITTDYSDEYQQEALRTAQQQQLESWHYKFISQPQEEKKEGIDMKGLFDVYMVYAEDRKKPLIKSVIGVIADSTEDAKIKSGLLKEIQEDWDADYLTFIVKTIGEVKVKEKPKEVKQV